MTSTRGLSPLEAALRRDRLVVITALVAVVVACWLYILAGAGTGMRALDMTAMTGPGAEMTTMAPDGDAMPGTGMADDPDGVAAGEGASTVMDLAMAAMTPVDWTPGYAVLMFFMWWIMMMAMMLPSASPMVLLFARVNRRQRERGAPYVSTGIFAAGYVVVWGAFSLVAVGLQWSLEQAGLISSMMASTSVLLGAGLLIAAGVYQLTPLKHACLRHCRSPLVFISQRWRPGHLGALRMGVEHGAWCAGCCWFLMALLFYGGVMNLFWIVGLALFVLVEKTLPAGHALGRVTGLLLVAWGGALLLGITHA